jgi:adenylate cyclase
VAGVVLLIGVAAAELVAIAVLVTLLVRARREMTRLAAELARATRPGPRSAAERAVKAVVETAVRVRDRGVGGLLMSSLDDLTRWATEDRAAIAQTAAPDGTVTIFFSDIEDSTALNERLGDARWMRLLTAHDAVVRRIVGKRGGHVVKSQGDGFMVVFGDRGAAADAALDIQESLRGGVRRARLKVRIGMHSGRVVARDGDYFGRNVALAARVAALAQGGQVLVSEDVCAALADRPDLTLEPWGEVELKGLSDKHSLWQLQRSSSGPARGVSSGIAHKHHSSSRDGT